MTDLGQQMKDFARGGLNLFWQRQAIFAGAAALAAYFYSLELALIFYGLALVSEMFDLVVSRKAAHTIFTSEAEERRVLALLTLASLVSAATVSFFAVLVAHAEGISSHFAPLFFLIAAGLFAAMNNHQILQILVARLIIYGFAFIYIPARDLWVTRAPFGSPLWLQFGTVLLVLYFIVDCARVFFRLYRRNLLQMDELRKERDRAEHAYEVQSHFISIVSHELRTPLTSIKGALGLIENGSLGEVPPQVQRLVATAYRNSDRLAVLINDLLDLQKLEAAQMTFNLKPLDISALVREAVDANETYARSLGITLEYKGTKKPVHVVGDHARLMQVMSNVLSNAAKFSKNGGRVEVSLKEDGGRARIAVRDFGEGIPPNSKDLVFGRFSQIDPTATRKIGGAGLGMSITRQILDAHDGVIDYVSELGKGTTFYIDLDLAPREDRDDSKEAARGEDPEGSSSSSAQSEDGDPAVVHAGRQSAA